MVMMEKRVGMLKSFRYMRLVILLLMMLPAASILTWSCRRAERRSEIQQVILISIDTCRADHLSCYGFNRETTPHVDAVAREGILFLNTVSPVPLTLPAHSSMLTGTIPAYHGVHDNMEYQLGSSNISLPEILREKGFKTAGIVSSFVLDKQFGLDQGFDSYNDHFEQEHSYLQISERQGEETTRLANAWLEGNKQERFFLFLHYYDPHTDYRPPEPFATTFKDNLYAGEIAYTDHCIGQVIDKLKQLGIYDSALIVIVGDHGEGLGQHGEDEHSFFIYQSTVKIPLIIKPPRWGKAQRVQEIVGLIDIVPTILGYLNLPAPMPLPGEDLRKYYEAKSSARQPRYLICESLYPTKYGCNPLLGLVSDPWKYIYTTNEELYQLEEDPDETINLAGQESNRARFMRNMLELLLGEQRRMEQKDNVLTLDAQSRARLESLGYVSGRTVEDFKLQPDKPDPKRYIGFHRLSHKYKIAIESKQFEQAKGICAKMLEEYPNGSEIYYLWGYAAFEQGVIEEAMANFGKFLQAEPDNFKGNYRMGLALMRVNKPTEAAAYFTRALQSDPDDYMVHGNLALALSQQGEYKQAELHYLEVLRLHPGDGGAHANLGVSLVMQDRIDEAIYHYQQALKINPKDTQTCVNLGKALAQQQNLDDAMVYWSRALQLLGTQVQEQVTLRDLMAQQLAARGRIDQAIYHWKEALKLAPNHYGIYYNLGLAYYSRGDIDQALSYWNMALQKNPDHVNTINQLAWVLATHPDEKIADPERAVQLAERACKLTENKHVASMDILGAAYAASGNFLQAVETAQKALQLALADKNQELAEQIRRRLQLYQARQPFKSP